MEENFINQFLQGSYRQKYHTQVNFFSGLRLKVVSKVFAEVTKEIYQDINIFLCFRLQFRLKNTLKTQILFVLRVFI